MAKRNKYKIGGYNLASPKDRRRLQSLTVELKLQAEALTQKDMRSWRQAWQRAIDIENPKRQSLYDIYRDVEVDLHLSGCVEQRKGFTQKKAFKLVDAKGKQDDKATALLEAVWFKDLVGYILDSRYWGHSLVQLGDVVTADGEMRYTGVELVNRKHVVPEYGVIVIEQSDDWTSGVPYREGPMADWVIEAGKPKDLGLYLRRPRRPSPKRT